MRSQPPLLLIPAGPEPLAAHVQLPQPHDNLFERLIRDPQAPHRPMRERQCAEMLRSVLVACPGLASFVFKWLAQFAGVPSNQIDKLEWSIETEQSIGSKRDDLRIEGWSTGKDGPQRVVLWTVEIKVAAPLHESSFQDWDEKAEPTSSNAAENVSQLTNYDRWLTRQKADFKAGFVLALRDMTADLPDKLEQAWHCFTWTLLALEIERDLAADLLPKTERPFAEHMLGFIRHRLWDTTNMSTPLELNDVALLQALKAIGPSCLRKLKGLVGLFEQSLQETGINFVDIKSSTSFFDRMDEVQYAMRARCVSGSAGEVSVSAGISGDNVQVSIGSYPRGCEAGRSSRKIVQQYALQLAERNSDWVISELDDNSYADASISKPLVSVLAHEEWQAPMLDFVNGALEDLRATGILDSLNEIQAEKN